MTVEEATPAPEKKESLPSRILSHGVVVPYVLLIVQNVFLTPTVRIPAPAFGWPLIVYGVAKSGPSGLTPPAWSWWVVAILLLKFLALDWRDAIGRLSVFMTALLLFRVCVGKSQAQWVKCCSVFVGVVFLSGLVLIISRAVSNELGIAIRRLLFVTILYDTPLGLATLVHIFGYQAAALGGLAVAAAAAARWRRWRQVLLAVPAIAIASLVLFWAMQRSAVLATAVAVLCMIAALRLKGLRSAVVIVATIAIAALSLHWMGPTGPETGLPANVYEKQVEDTDEIERLALQLEALELLVRHPLGYILSGYDWNRMVAEKRGVLYSAQVSSHNAYLQAALELGFPAVLLLLYGFWSMSHTVRGVLVNERRHGFRRFLPLAMVLALVATVVNATLHNSGITTADGPTVFCFVAAHHWWDLVRAGQSAS